MRNDSFLRKDGVGYVLPFVLVTSCFALWGFANDITNPMVKAFSKIFRMSVTDGALVQVAFYGGYFAMAIPAALFIRRYSYKAGVLMGLGLYALGAFLFLPAQMLGAYYPFLVAYFILTCGLSFLETSCNPYVMSMGTAASATRRLNFAQCFNPCGSILGMFVAMNCIQNRLNPMSSDERALLSECDFEIVKQSDLQILITPYVAIGLVILVMFVAIWAVRVPQSRDGDAALSLRASLAALLARRDYCTGVVAQFFYVGAQIMCWTFIIQYGTHVLQGQLPNAFEHRVLAFLGSDTQSVLTERSAEVLSQGYNIVAMLFFICSRFLCTYLMKFINAARLLGAMAVVAVVLTAAVIGLQGRAGIYCLVLVSICMSLMFPTIYGIALHDMGDEAKLGAAGLIMAILGGSVLTPIQASIIDLGTVAGFPAVNLSFVLPLICFLVVAVYGFRMARK